MKFNARGLAAMALLTAVVGCTVNTGTGTTPATGSSTKPASTSPNAQASATTGGSTGGNTGTTGGSTGATATKSPVPAFMCTTPKDYTLATDSNDFPTAQMVDACALVKGSVAASGDDDHRFFKVTIPDGPYDGNLMVTYTEANAEFGSEVRFYNDAKTELTSAFAADRTTSPLNASQPVTAGKTYYVRVNLPSEMTDISVKIAFAPVVDANERNDDFTTAAPLALTAYMTDP